MSKKLPYIFLIVISLVLAVSPVNTVIASRLNISHGIMPDSILYNLDLQYEELQININQNDNQKLAELHYQYSEERLNELDYLTDQDDITLEKAISINENYQQNITEYTKIISTKKNTDEVNQIVPQIENLQNTQTKVVDKINSKPVNEEVKIIVKSSIKESQDNLIMALASASKPIIEQQKSNQEQAIADSPDNAKITATTQKVDNALNNLNDTKNSLKEEIKTDEEALKQKKEATTETQTTEVNTIEVNTDDQIDSNDINTAESENAILENPDTSIPTDPTQIDNSIPVETKTDIVWYYSSSCDYLSDKPGKDPVCGDDLIPVSSLPPDSSFFTKYQYADGKYTQNIETIADKSTNEAASEIVNIIDDIQKNNQATENPTDNTITPSTEIITPTDTPIDNINY